MGIWDFDISFFFVIFGLIVKEMKEFEIYLVYILCVVGGFEENSGV